MRFNLQPLVKGTTLAAILASTALLSPLAAYAEGAVTFAVSVEPQGLDPTFGAPVAAGQVTWQNVFEGLVTIDSNGGVEPQLATSWTISDDGLTYEFTLRDGVFYHNGAAFTAETAAFSIARIIAEDSTNGQKALYRSITSAEATGPLTLKLTLSEPTSDLIYWLGFPAAVLVEPGSAETNGAEPVGTGPFKVSEWRKGDRVIMEAYDGYWGQKPALEMITARFIGDPQAQASALKSGQVNLIAELAAPELFEQFTSDDKFSAVEGVGEMEVIAGMNNTRPPFDDARVRQALMKSIDRSLLIDAAQSGYGTPIGSHFSPASPHYVDMTGLYGYDPAAAKDLLAEAGYADGFEFTFSVPNRPYAQRSAEVMQAFFQEIGVTAKLETTDFPAAWVPKVFKDTDYDMTIIGHAEPLDIGIYAREKYYFNYQSADMVEAMKTINMATTPESRTAGYKVAQEIVATDIPALYLFSFAKLGVWDAKLHGVWTNGPVPSNDLTDVSWAD